MYIVLEALVEKRIIRNIILSEIMDEYFIGLYNWAKVKPGLQVFWSEGTVLPPTLDNFIKENSVKVLTHRDPKAILPHYVLDITLMDINHPFGLNYSIQWLSRIEVLQVNNGEVKRKGCNLKFAY
ncbi:glutamate--cysteine ligase regulatory subunit-like [Hetaerina americana]|uniref:glutamate--cysteine ligase regulatory subunit-like n=1 Tax=Hetaerina americana TaxID=62018 RepID=UPI003A7F59CC